MGGELPRFWGPSLEEVWGWLSEQDWPAALEASAAVVTAVLAYKAIKIWRQQDSAAREADFLDKLVDEMHNFISQFSRPLAQLRVILISIRSHSPREGTEDERLIEGVQAFIACDEGDSAAELIEALKSVQPSLIALQSLMAKGQVFGFRDYPAAYHNLLAIIQPYSRCQSVAEIIDRKHWNWQNDEVRRVALSTLKIDVDDVSNSIGRSNAAVIYCTNGWYRSLYAKGSHPIGGGGSMSP